MTTITVTAGDSAHAMEKVLDQLGPDAYILESRKDGNRFQIRATDDPKNVIPKAPATPRAPVSASKGKTIQGLFEDTPLGGKTTSGPRPSDLAPIVHEIRQLKQALAGMTLTTASGLNPEIGFSPALKLIQTGYSEELVHTLYKPFSSLAPEHGRSAFLQALAERLIEDEMNWLKTSRIICVLGPSGAGKTTLACKIATSIENDTSAKPFDLACLSGKPSIIQEPIHNCGRLLNKTPIHFGTEAFAEQLGETSRRMVIDVAVPSVDGMDGLEAAMKRFGPEKLTFILAIPGGASRQLIRIQLEEYAPLKPYIALTKLDECEVTPTEISGLAEASAKIGLMTGSKSLRDGIAIAQSDVLKQYLDINF